MLRVVPSLRRSACAGSFVVTVALSFVLAASALALDPKKTAEALAARAAKAYESGNMVESATLYRDAYQMDPTGSAYLYGAARAAQTGHDLKHAEADYRAFLELESADAARVQKAKVYLAAVRAELAGLKAAEADQVAAAGDAVLATSLYLEAWKMAPDQADPLLKAGLQERKRGEKKAAIEHLQRYLQLAPGDATGRGTALEILKELGGKVPEPATSRPAPANVEPGQSEPVNKGPIQPPVAAAKSTSTRAVLGWTAMGVGGAALIGGAILAVVASGNQTDLDTYRVDGGKFDSARITLADAAARQTGINNTWAGMAVAAGAGVVGVGVGAWLLATDHPGVAVLPTANGMQVAGRF